MLKSQQGFTLLELLIVIAMISIFFGMAVVKINDVVAINHLNSAADQLVIDLRTMQQLSLQKSSSNNPTINLTLSATTYQINSPGTTSPTVIMPANVTITSTDKNPLTYNPYDITQNKENMIILTSTTINKSKTIVICKETGRIRIDSASPASYRSEEK